MTKSDEVRQHEWIREQAERTKTVWADPGEVALFGAVADLVGVEASDVAIALDLGAGSEPFRFFSVYTTDTDKFDTEPEAVRTWAAFMVEDKDAEGEPTGSISLLFPAREVPDFWEKMTQGMDAAMLIEQAFGEAK